MNKKERLEKVLCNGSADRVPASFWRHFGGEDAKGKRCIEKHIEFYKNTNLDFIKVMHDGLIAPCSLDINDISDLKKYRVLGTKNDYIRSYVERAKGIVESIGDEVYVYTNVFTPFTLLRRIGDEKLASYIKQDKAIVLNALDVMAQEISLLSELLIKEAGCLGLFIAYQGCETNRFTEEEFAEIVYPSDMMVTSTANAASDNNILHFCAWDEDKNRLSTLKKYPGKVVNWAIFVEELSLSNGRQLFDNRPVMGGFDNRRGRVLYAGTRQEVEQETKKIVDDYVAANGSTEGLIMGADCSFLLDFDIQRLNWVVDTLEKY